MTEPPTPSEMDRRLQRLESQLTDLGAQLNKRLDGFPTEQTIIALFAVRDTQITAQAKALADLNKELDQERRDRDEAIQRLETRQADTRRWTFGAVLGVVSITVALLGFAANLLGA